MKVTKPPRETVSSLNYRDAEGTPTQLAPELDALARAALAVLARDGAVADGGRNSGDRTWAFHSGAVGDIPLRLELSGPDLPSDVPEEAAHPSGIPFERPWVGTYRLIVRAPLVVMDLYWRADQPLRIMGFSRGDWEDALIEVAR